MTHNLEYISYSDNDRLAMLENRAAELERRIAQATPSGGLPEFHASDHGTVAFPAFAPPHENDAYGDSGRDAPEFDDPDYPEDVPAGAGYREAPVAGSYRAALTGLRGGSGERTRSERLINGGRQHVKRGPRRWFAHWRAILIGAAAFAAAIIILAMVLQGGSPGWPASVATVQTEITTACQNANVVSEPAQVNFACAKDTQQILWVFSLLTSDNNPGYADKSNGRKGLEPIQPAQGGDIAWSLNLHHPYDAANPIDSLEVAARAINNIIGGATVTGTSGAPVVQQGLESSPANCAKYTGSSALITRQGFPAVCALPVSTTAGQAALVSDVFSQWMVGAPAQFATEAGVLFQNANNPGDPRVQSILNTLRTSGM
jgi:hypothetical protein